MIGSLVGDSCILTSMRRFSVTENCSIPVKKADVCPESLRDFPPSQLIRYMMIPNFWNKSMDSVIISIHVFHVKNVNTPVISWILHGKPTRASI